MTEKNKTDFIFFLKMAGLFVWGIIAIINFAGVLNYCPENFVKWCAGILLAGNAVIIYTYGKRLVADKNAAIEAIQAKERQELIDSAKK